MTNRLGNGTPESQIASEENNLQKIIQHLRIGFIFKLICGGGRFEVPFPERF